MVISLRPRLAIRQKFATKFHVRARPLVLETLCTDHIRANKANC